MKRSLSERIDARLTQVGITARAASLESGGGPDVIRDIKRATQRGRQGRVNADYLLGLCRAMQVPPEFFSDDFDDSALPPPKRHGDEDTDSANAGGARSVAVEAPPHDNGKASSMPTNAGRVPEIDVRGGMGPGGLAAWDYRPDRDGTPMEVDGELAEWFIPPDYLRRELRVRNGDARIIEVQGDSMEPTLLPGDRVMIDTGSRVPSPPGVFALWDGLGVVVKRLEFIPNTDPMRFIISSDNPKHERYERTSDELSVIGRVVWFGRRL